MTTSDTPVTIRPFQAADWPAVWPILRTTFQAGDTYAFAPDSTEAEIHKAWVDLPAATFVALGVGGGFWAPTSSSRISLGRAPMCATAVMWWRRQRRGRAWPR